MWEDELAAADEQGEAVVEEVSRAVGTMLAPIDVEAAARMFEAGGFSGAAERARRDPMDMTVRELLAACIDQGYLPAIFLTSEEDGRDGAELFGAALTSARLMLEKRGGAAQGGMPSRGPEARPGA